MSEGFRIQQDHSHTNSKNACSSISEKRRPAAFMCLETMLSRVPYPRKTA